MEIRMEAAQKTKNRIRSSYTTTVYTHKKDCKHTCRDTCISMFTAALFTIANLWFQPRCPTTDKSINKVW
jgi:hypothetical protein